MSEPAEGPRRKSTPAPQPKPVSSEPRRSVWSRLFGRWFATRPRPAKSVAKKCPRCFSERLVVERSGTFDSDADESPRRRTKGQSRSDESTSTETGYVECKKCGYRFLRSYQKMHRLHFPTIGVRASGKLSLLTTAYDRVCKGTAPTVAVVQKAQVLGNELFDLHRDDFVNQKRTLPATPHCVPDPLVLHVRDADPNEPTSVLVHLHNFAGEMLNQPIDCDHLKKQAAQMDGFVLLLDPTQLHGDGMGSVTLDRQLSALTEFMGDVRTVRGVPLGQLVPVPVAVVVPKLDLLLTDNPIQRQCLPFLRHLLADLNPSPRQTTLGTLNRRSDLLEEMLPLLFPGVDVRVIIEGYFGGPILFFPASSVGLVENELGIKDLSKRTFAPFGVAEPFLWLLHSHGYRVFLEN